MRKEKYGQKEGSKRGREGGKERGTLILESSECGS
jgi:hypothetical protein